MGAVVIGMDPHKRSATIEVVDGDETILGGGRYATDVAGYNAMLKFGKQPRADVGDRGLQRDRETHREPASR